MAVCKLLLLSALIALGLREIAGHGKMVDPLNRSSVWRLKTYDDVPTNTEDNENFCGGFAVQYNDKNKGRCGPCGDNYSDPVPRKNENGGAYGRGHIVKKYKSGAAIDVTVDLTANHKGYFNFSLCELQSPKDVETEECFLRHPLKVINEQGRLVDRYNAGEGSELKHVKLQLPEGFKCEHCVLRWHYRTGNNWGVCTDDNGKEISSGLGCGPQETFRSCADVAVI